MILKTTFLPILTTILVVFISCNNEDKYRADGMARFTKDAAFQNSHEIPKFFDYLPRGEMIIFSAPDGEKASAYVVRPSIPTTKKLMVFHEWWGLNDHIRLEAERLFDSLGVEVWALDLYDGEVATDREQAGKLMQSRKQERLEAIIRGAIRQLGPDAEIATTGWCFGGGWSLGASLLAGKQSKACVIYYGMPVDRADQLAPLTAPVLGLFGEKDAWINQDVVDRFDALCKATGKSFEWEMYPADHGFANPSSPKFSENPAKQANARSLQFLRTHLLP
jgi:carboxymethylenebutenolidase